MADEPARDEGEIRSVAYLHADLAAWGDIMGRADAARETLKAEHLHPDTRAHWLHFAQRLEAHGRVLGRALLPPNKPQQQHEERPRRAR